MYKEILLNFAYSELLPFVDEGSLLFAKKALGKEITFTNIVDYLTVQGGRHTLQKKSFRHAFIDKISREQIANILRKIGVDCTRVDYTTYKTLRQLSDQSFDEFCDLLGLESSAKSSVTTRLFQSTHLTLPNYPSYPYQRDITKRVSALIDSSQGGRSLIHLPTGAGKTRTAMNIVCEHLRENEKGVVVWLADKAELCEQAQEEFIKAWQSLGNREISSYSFYDKSNLSFSGIDSGFIVMGLQKLKYYEDSGNPIVYEQLQNSVSLVVFDEAHKAIAPTYAASVSKLIYANKDSAFVLGLTATPGRRFSVEDESNDEDAKLANFFGNNKVTMRVHGYKSPVTYLIESGYLAKPHFESLSYNSESSSINFTNYRQREKEILEALANLDVRNKSIIDAVLTEYEKGSMIILFACDVQHAVDLAFTLSCFGVNACSLDSKNDDDMSRKFKIENFKAGKIRVIVNYGILTTGFDAPKTNVAIIARPTMSLVLYMQMVGRAMRGYLSGGNKECRIYTINDDIPEFSNVTKAFEHWDQQWQEV